MVRLELFSKCTSNLKIKTKKNVRVIGPIGTFTDSRIRIRNTNYHQCCGSKYIIFGSG